MKATRRSLLTASAGVASRPIGRATAGRRSITFAAYSGIFQDLYEPAIVHAFERAHPDISVFWYAMPAASQALATLRRQRGQPEIDVVLLDLPAARTATDEGLLEPITIGNLPVIADLAPGAAFPSLAGPAVFSEPLVMLFNTAQVRPGPTSWKFLWNGLAGQTIAIAAPPDPAGLAFALAAARLFGGGGTDQRAVDEGLIAVNQLATRVVSWDPRPDVYRFVGEGGAMLGVGWNLPGQIHAERLGGRLSVAFPEDGTLSRVTTVNLVRGGRQLDAARLFVAYLLGVEAQKTMVEKMFLGPVNARAKYLEAALARTANTPARVARAMPVDWVSVNAMRDDITRRWREVVGRAG